MRVDRFFTDQPAPDFIEYLKSPVHKSPPPSFGKRKKRADEVSLLGAYIEAYTPWADLLSTAADDLTDFLNLTSVFGDKYPIRVEPVDGTDDESFELSVSERECVIRASDKEGARRGIYFVEQEMIRRGGAFLPKGTIKRTCYIKKRITRGFFSPTNRPPKWGDELFDEIDYYPENYLSRLAHNGTNGLWIYTSFRQLIKSPYMNIATTGCERRMEKLKSIVERCKRYGIGVYLFAIEPLGLTADELDGNLDMLGAPVHTNAPTARRPLCPRIDKTRDHIIYCIENIYRAIPDLKGYISITAGERPTTCSSVGNFCECPRCGKYSRGENLAHSINIIKEGLRRAGTGAEFISWTYGHRYWNGEDIREYVNKAPMDVVLMQNFEDKGINIQLGKPRIAWDYWLSYTGPSDMMADTAKRARKSGKSMYAKMQVCSSHELATVPYIPAPGILFDKYKAARELGVTGILECWYFGNYPSVMSLASTELSYIEDFTDKRAFLLYLAKTLYSEENAESVADAWEAFENAYRSCPTNIMFSYYGPLHDGIAWELHPIPKNRSLPRSWLLLDPPDGDRIGECLFASHTHAETLELLGYMSREWQRGLDLLKLDGRDELVENARAIGLLTRSAYAILDFYRLRDELGRGVGDPYATLCAMEGIVCEEIERSREMSELCERDVRIGYHSEAEGYKFFPKKLKARIRQLEGLFRGEFKEIRARLDGGQRPLGYYYAEGEDAYPLYKYETDAPWERLDKQRSFRIYGDEQALYLNVRCKKEDEIALTFEFQLFYPESTVIYSPAESAQRHSEISGQTAAGLNLGEHVLSHQGAFGDGIEEVLSRYSIITHTDGEYAEHLISVRPPMGKWDGKRAIKMRLRVGGVLWKIDPDPVRTLGKDNISPGDFGFILPQNSEIKG